LGVQCRNIYRVYIVIATVYTYIHLMPHTALPVRCDIRTVCVSYREGCVYTPPSCKVRHMIYICVHIVF
jgi:hypothetical protein